MKEIRFSIRIRKELNELLKRKAKKYSISKNSLINLILNKEIEELMKIETKESE